MLEGQNIKIKDYNNIPEQKKREYLMLFNKIVNHENIQKFKPI